MSTLSAAKQDSVQISPNPIRIVFLLRIYSPNLVTWLQSKKKRKLRIVASSFTNGCSDKPRCLFYMSQQKLLGDNHQSEPQKGKDKKQEQNCIFSIEMTLNYEVEYLPHHYHMNLKSKKLPSACLDSSFFIDNTKVHDTMRRSPINSSVGEQDFNSIVKVVPSKAKSIKDDPRNVCSSIIHIVMSLRVIWVQELNLEAVQAWERLLPQGQVFSFNLPATEMSIRELDKLIFDKDYCLEEQCAICLKEFDTGEKVTRMPCLHVYHGDCILKWLNSCHFCPSCRCPMPVCKVVDGTFPFLKRKLCAPAPAPMSGGKI